MYTPLSHWHGLTDLIKRRQGHSSNDEITTRLYSAKTGCTTKAQAARLEFNVAIGKYVAAEPKLDGRLNKVSKDALFAPATLGYVAGLVNPSDFEEEPWVTDSHLAAAMDMFELLARLDEEQSRFAAEIDGMRMWWDLEEFLLLERRKALYVACDYERL
ncbi:hypothetical protein CF319_g8077 [Tilletia indica]|nr:hypothetical protein CF319_g8077 [Tilletia indica]